MDEVPRGSQISMPTGCLWARGRGFGGPGCLATGHTVTSFKQANCHTRAVTDLDSRAAYEIPFHRALTVSTYGQWRHSRQQNMLSIVRADTLYIRASQHLETHGLSATPR